MKTRDELKQTIVNLYNQLVERFRLRTASFPYFEAFRYSKQRIPDLTIDDIKRSCNRENERHKNDSGNRLGKEIYKLIGAIKLLQTDKSKRLLPILESILDLALATVPVFVSEQKNEVDYISVNGVTKNHPSFWIQLTGFQVGLDVLRAIADVNDLSLNDPDNFGPMISSERERADNLRPSYSSDIVYGGPW